MVTNDLIRTFALTMGILLVLASLATAAPKHELLREDIGSVMATSYGSALTSATISAALVGTDGIGSTNRVLILSTGTWTISSDITIPRLWLPANTIVTVNAGVTLIISEWFAGGGMFTGAGVVLTPKMPAVTPEDFGAVTGVDASNALRLALNSGAGIVHLPSAYTTSIPVRVQRSNLRIDGGGSLTALSTFTANNPTNRGMLTIGESTTSPFPTTSVRNIRIQDVILDGGTYGSPLYITACTDCVVSKIEAKNSDVGVIRGYLNISMTVEYSRVTNANGVFGDGIYCGGCYEFRAIGNRVDDYTRIGIVSEQEGSTKTNIFWAQDNTITGAHNATAPENNAGIWSENTYATHIVHNTIADQWNSPPDIFSSRCIQLNNMAGGGTQTFSVQGNILSGCLLGVGVAPNATAQVAIRDTQLRKGTVAALLWGIHIGSGAMINIDGLQLGDNVWTGGGGILVDIATADDIRTLTIRNVTSGETTATTYASGGGDIVMYGTSGGGALQELTISDVQQARVVMSLPVAIVHMTNSTLTTNAAGYLLHASAYGTISNSIITQTTAGTTVFRALPTATTELINVTCHACTPSLNNATPGSPHLFLVNGGTFDQGSHIDINGEFMTSFRGVRWPNFPDDGYGAIAGNNSSGYSWSLYVRDCDFSLTGTYTIPIVLTADPATAVFAQGNTWTGTTDYFIYGLTRASMVGTDVIAGTGAPEGQITARIGTIYRRYDGAANTTLCVKESGSNTDTGWICK